MESPTADKFKAICCRLHEAIPPSFARQWDDRFGVALISFDSAVREKILAALKADFPHQWDKSSIGKARKEVNKTVKSVFNINTGQFVFSTDENQIFVLLAAWWPWGNGATISLRVGIFAAGNETIDDAEAKKLLTSWFSIA